MKIHFSWSPESIICCFIKRVNIISRYVSRYVSKCRKMIKCITASVWPHVSLFLLYLVYICTAALLRCNCVYALPERHHCVTVSQVLCSLSVFCAWNALRSEVFNKDIPSLTGSSFTHCAHQQQIFFIFVVKHCC